MIDQVVREGIMEEVTFESRYLQYVSHMDVWGRTFQTKGRVCVKALGQECA